MCFQNIIVTPRNSEILTYIFIKFCGCGSQSLWHKGYGGGGCTITSETDKESSLLSIPSFSDEEGDA